MADPKFDNVLQGNHLYVEDGDGRTLNEFVLRVEMAQYLTKAMGSPLFIACIRGDIARMKELIASGVNVDTQNHYGETALHYAAAYGNMEAIRVLMEAGANPFIKTYY